MRIHIKGGYLLNPIEDSTTQVDIFIAQGKIIALGSKIPSDFTVDYTIDAFGLSIIPGLIDICARLYKPNNKYYCATLDSEMISAVAGGITSIVCPPDINLPFDEPGFIDMLQARTRKISGPHVYPLAALTMGLSGQIITEMVQLHDSGCVGFSQANQPLINSKSLLHAMQYAKTYNFTIWLRPIDASLSIGCVVASGAFASKRGLCGIPIAAETIALHTIFELVRATGVSVHISHLSSAAGIALVRQAKLEGLPISCDVTIHHIHLCDVDIGYFNSAFRFDPPLRQNYDRQAICNGLIDGTIDIICSDHTPLNKEHKLLPFAEAVPGAIGTELFLSLILKWIQDKNIPLVQALKLVTINAAKLIGLNETFCMVGSRADLCIFDESINWRVEPSSLLSQGHNTPFIGYELPGQVMFTLVNGHIVYEHHSFKKY